MIAHYPNNSQYYNQVTIATYYRDNHNNWPTAVVQMPRKKVYDWVELAAAPIAVPCTSPVLPLVRHRPPRHQAGKRSIRRRPRKEDP